MGKTRDLFKKIRATQGIFHAKMGTVKDRNYMDMPLEKSVCRSGSNIEMDMERQTGSK